jgi:hypothetical protein
MSSDSPEPEAPQPLRSRHTANFPALLDELGVSLLVTTYQAGKLVLLRSAGTTINTHFRDLHRPMGLAADPTRVAVGVAQEIRQYRNMTPVCRLLEPPGRHDACFLARAAHVTGDIDIHEMTWVGDELWFVNTRFSCLCTLNGIHSFVPRWRPPFVTALAPEDRCHLNGLWLGPDSGAAGPVGYATALAATDTPQGWREHKKDGGVLLEVPSGKVVAGGLAFVGLSQVRESAVFSGIPIAERALAERNCGVWVLDVRTGRTVAFLRFEDAVQEVFAVTVLPGLRYPELAPPDPKLLADSYDFAPQGGAAGALRPLTRTGAPRLTGRLSRGRRPRPRCCPKDHLVSQPGALRCPSPSGSPVSSRGRGSRAGSAG